MLGSKQKILLVNFFVLILFLSAQPFYVWRIWENIALLIAFSGFALYGLWEIKNDSVRRISFIFLFCFYFYASLHQYQDRNFVGVIVACMRHSFVITLFFISDDNWLKIYKKFVLVYSIAIIPSLLIYFIVVWGNVNLPYTVIPPYLNEYKDYNYLAYPFLVVSDQLEYVFRFHGYFDEPGVVGTISGALLIINRCDFRKWINWPLLISGVFSFSLFFYIIVSLYLLLLGSKKSKMVLVIIVTIAITYLATDAGPFSDLIMSRLEFGSDGEWSGDNRTTMGFDIFWKKFLMSDMLWFGYGKDYSLLVADTGGASYKHLFVDFGVVMTIVYLIGMILFYISHKLKLKMFLITVMIFFSILFQRPFIFSLLYVFLLIAPASVLKHTE